MFWLVVLLLLIAIVYLTSPGICCLRSHVDGFFQGLSGVTYSVVHAGGEGMSGHRVNDARKVTLYYTDWCTHCKTMHPLWDRVKHSVRTGSTSRVVFEENNEEKNPTPGITGYPTIIMVAEDGKRYQYSGGPDEVRLRQWVTAPLPY